MQSRIYNTINNKTQVGIMNKMGKLWKNVRRNYVVHKAKISIENYSFGQLVGLYHKTQ